MGYSKYEGEKKFYSCAVFRSWSIKQVNNFQDFLTGLFSMQKLQSLNVLNAQVLKTLLNIRVFPIC